jgi:phage baseplate assembly protein V
MSEFSRLLRPLAQRLSNMLVRGTVAAVDAERKMQVVQVRLLAGEIKDNVEHFEPYGHTAKPLAGAEAIVAFFDGDRSHGVVLAVGDRRFRLTGLQDGEVAIYDDQGQKVHLTRDGVVIHTAKQCRIEASDIALHASQSYSWDVAGFGERWTAQGGGAWEHKTWQTGAVVTSVSLPINPPEGP